jgi:antitoxin MazE|tara:strand:- start:287 stop:496 length:210 start_codon:yes stop_codon:yes gene_type:complete
MAQIIKIGNSQGIRIPKPIISLANLDNKELDFVVLDSGLLITSQKKARSGWERHHNEEKPMAIWEWWKD